MLTQTLFLKKLFYFMTRRFPCRLPCWLSSALLFLQVSKRWLLQQSCLVTSCLPEPEHPDRDCWTFSEANTTGIYSIWEMVGVNYWPLFAINKYLQT